MGIFFRNKKEKSDSRGADISETKTVQPEFVPSKSEAVPSPAKKRFLSYQFGNLQGVGARSGQEDAFGFVNVTDVIEIRDKGFMAIVADGMGGMKGGSYASETAVSMLRSAFDSLDYSANLPNQLNAAMLKAGEEIYNTLGGEGGSTAIACLFYNGELYYSSVGDSYLMLKRDNQLLRINRPHNVETRTYCEEIRKMSTDTTRAHSDSERAALVGFLGMEENEDIDYFKRALPLHDGDVVMICSDGVAGFLSDECMLSCLNMPVPSQMCAELDRCINELNIPKQDNYTALIIKCEY